MKISEYSKPALRTALYFFVFGFLWILLSDNFVSKIAASTEIEQKMQTYKGWFFILSTTILIFLVVKQQLKIVVMLKNRLEKSEQRYKKIVNITHDLIWNTDIDGVITFINDASKSILGYSPKEMTGKKFSDFGASDQYRKNLEAFPERLTQGLNSIEFETEISHPGGRKIYLRHTVVAVLDNKGKLERYEGASANITESKIYEQKLLENKQRLELAMFGGEIGLWEYWHLSKKLHINENWKKIFGIDFRENEIDMEFIYDMVHPGDKIILKQSFGNPQPKTEQFIEQEFRMKHADGSYRWVTGKGKVVEWADGKPLRMMGIIIDTTEKKNLEIELQNLVKLYSSFISISSEGIYLFEMNQPMPVSLPVEEQIKLLYHNGYIRTCNNAFAKMYGYQTAEEMVGTDQQTLHGGDDDPRNIELLRRFIASDYRIMNDITKEVDKDGNVLFISNSVVGIIENGMLLRTWGSQTDITAQVLARQKMEESENRYRLLFETNPVPLAIFDDETFIFKDTNQAIEKLIGYSKEELLHMTIRDLRPDISDFSAANISELIQRELTITTEIMLKTKSGKSLPCEVKFDQIIFRGNSAVFAAIIDMSGIKAAEKMVIQSLIEGADNERSRVAKELHDGLGQYLTAASLNLNSISSSINKLGEKNEEKFNTGVKFLKTAIEESRNIAHNLMPKAIEDFGIVLSLKSLFNQIEKTTNLKINFYENIGEKIRLDIQVELNIYRITQEAVNNVFKHANASEIFVQLMLHPNEIIYTFEDNGIGFDKLISNSGKKGIGIKSMYNRAKAMSGYCDVESLLNEGTTITIVIPIEQ
ncbi:MAG: PAS domain S-box protein [Bacteroidales bacterium]|nr:PAS domain S-box protein [Bacteroidales bacterium]